MSGQTSNGDHVQLAPAPEPFLRETAVLGMHLYDALAIHLMDEIRRGVYPVGSQLPPVRALAHEADVTPGTVTKAYEILAQQAIVRIVERRGAFVQRIPHLDDAGTSHDPGTAEEPPARPAPAAPIPQRPMQTIHAQSTLPPSRIRIAHLVTDVWTPTPDIAAALRQQDYSAPVVVRYRIITDANTGHPLEVRTSYTPAAIAAGTPIAQPIELPGPWESIIYEATGQTPATATATTTARHPNQSEAQTLGIPEHGIVLVRETALYATRDTSGPALSLTRSVWPADTTRVTLAYPVAVG